MKKIVIYCSDYIGHVMECLGIAQDIRSDGYEVIFAFITYPTKKAYDLLTSKGMMIDVSNVYIKAAVRNSSYNELMKALIDSVTATLKKYQPVLVICDADNIVPLICRKLGIKSAAVKRTNIPAPIVYKQDFQDGVLFNNLITVDEVDSLCELVEGEVQLIPHSEFFFKINSKNPYYYCPKEAQLNDTNKQAEKYDVLCVLSTAYDMKNYKDAVLQAFRNTKYRVLICYPQTDKEEMIGNVQIVKWANIDELIKVSDLVISTGGHGIMTKSIINKKPQIILEVDELFAIYYGKQLEEHRLGVFLRINEISNDSIRAAADELYMNENYQMHINFMSETIINLGHFKINKLINVNMKSS